MQSKFTIDAISFCETSAARAVNEDCVMLSVPDGIFIVCDGVGSSGCGAFASSSVPKLIAAAVCRQPLISVEAAEEVLGSALLEAHTYLLTASPAHHPGSNCSTTIVVGLIVDQQLLIAHVGDSRAYHLGDKINQLTQDHTIAQQMLDRGVPRPTLPRDAHQTLWQSLGGVRNIYPSITSLRLQRGDRFLFCTDGVYNQIRDREILTLSQASNTVALFATRLRFEVDASAPSDNFSAIVLGIETQI